MGRIRKKMNIEKKHAKFICLLIILPNVLCLPFWLIGKNDLILNFQTGFNIFIVPFVICIFGSLKMNINPTLTILTFLLSGVTGSLLNYLGWGLWSGGLLNPDLETVMIQMFAIEFQTYGALVAGLIQLLRFLITKYSTPSSE